MFFTPEIFLESLMSRVHVRSAIVAVALLGLTAASDLARGDLVLSKNFESDTIGVDPPAPWVQTASLGMFTVQANPLPLSPVNPSSQALNIVRPAPNGNGRLWHDLPASASADIAAGQLMMVRFKHYQPSTDLNSFAVLFYPNDLHDFSENMIDLELKAGGGRNIKYFDGSELDTGLDGTDGWDNIEMTINTVSNHWSISVNGGTPVGNIPFIGNADFSTVRSFLLSPSAGNISGYIDDIQVFVGEVPEPTGMTLLAGATATIVSVRRRSARRKSICVL